MLRREICEQGKGGGERGVVRLPLGAAYHTRGQCCNGVLRCWQEQLVDVREEDSGACTLQPVGLPFSSCGMLGASFPAGAGDFFC